VTPASPVVVGIVNVTDDSFSDGGRYLDSGRAVAHARRLVADGAGIVELGPASSRPEAKPVSAEEEVRRLEGVVEPLLAEGLTIAIDSCQRETQGWAIERGVQVLNDVRGFPDRGFDATLAAASCRLVVMHAVAGGPTATRETVDPAGIVERTIAFLHDRVRELEAAGIARERLVVDPGMGLFLGADVEASLRVLRELGRVKAALGLPLLVSVSRKGFLGALTGRPVAERGAATLAAELWAAAAGADYVRTHDVRALADGLAVRRAIAGRSIRG